MSFSCTVDEGGRLRRFAREDFPLSLGGRKADIEIPGLEAGDPGAFLALDGGELYVQPREGCALSIGGQPLSASHWLRDGDELRLVATRIRFSLRGDGPLLLVEHLPLDRQTKPPAILVSPAVHGDALVQPAAYRPTALAPVSREAARSRRGQLGWLALAPLVGLLAATGYLLAARAVEVRVEPEPERLSVRGAMLPAIGGVRLLLPGRYTVLAERARYRPLEAPLEVTSERRQLARYTLELLPGRLAFQVTPASGVAVFVDGAAAGTTPLQPLDVPAGEHEITLRAEGYAAFTTRVAVAGGGELQELSATLSSDRAPVSFASEPAGASVRIDGALLGRTPLTADLSSGRRSLEVALAGHRPGARSIEVVAGVPLTVPAFRLQPLPGRLALASQPAGAAVTVDGEFRGETPLELTLEPRVAHALRLSKTGHETAAESVLLGLDESRSLSVALTPRLGDVLFAAEPPDSELLVDGELRGRASQTLQLAAAPHAIEIRRAGYEPHKASVTPRPGFPQEVRVRLRSLEEARAAARPSSLSVRGHELKLLTPGRFQMGASRREPGRRANESLREVVLSRHFYMAAREVSNAQFRRFKNHSSGTLGGHDLDGDDHPAVQVTWELAAEYCNWLSAQEGLPPVYVRKDGKLVATSPVGTGYRLPTEAEWSRAARYPGSGPLKYPWGAALPVPPRSGNYADETARPIVSAVIQGYDDRYPASAPVGTFPANALGFFDLGGNVAEWAHDVYSIPPAEGPVETDPVGPAAGDLHVIVGSSFLQGTVGELRLSYRDYGTKPRIDVGFRIARYAE